MPTQKLIRERQCAYCGKTFQLTPVGYFKGQKCCSPECASQLRKGIPNLKNSKPKIAKMCPVCGKEFFVQPAQSHIICCSTTCAGIRQSSERKGEKAANWKGGKVEAVCEFCGKAYRVFRYRDDETHYCSKNCAMHAINKGEKSYRWKGGPQILTCQYCCKEFREHVYDSGQKYCSPRCHRLARPTSIESAIHERLRELGIEFIPEYHVVGRWSVDIYVPSAHLAIECDGDFWHRSARSKARDARKDTILAEHGISVLRLPEYDIREHPDYCLQLILSRIKSVSP